MKHHPAFLFVLMLFVLLVSSVFGVVLLPAFVVWANTELQHFVSRFSCQVFSREMGVAAIGVCVSMAKQQCEKVNRDRYHSKCTFCCSRAYDKLVLYFNAAMYSST